MMTFKKVKHFHFNLTLVLGIGYWKDTYRKENIGIDGVQHNLVLPFAIIRWGYLMAQDFEKTEATEEEVVEIVENLKKLLNEFSPEDSTNKEDIDNDMS